MYRCENCNREFKEKNHISNHKKGCGKIKPQKNNNLEEKTCPKCNHIINNSLAKHINICKGFGPRIKNPKLTEEEKKIKYERKNLILKEKWSDPVFKESALLRMKSLGGLTGKGKNKELENKRKTKISTSMKNNPNSGGYRKGSGRGKSGWYKGYWCDSSWELAWVIYNIDHGIRFERNSKKFEYFLNDKKRMYMPDFVINEGYYEIKGRRSFNNLDEENKQKILQFKGDLKVLYEKDMELYLTYVKNEYGKDFIRLYEER
jgi:hypothetical protein